MGSLTEHNIWQIRDDNGVIFSGTEYEMDSAWDVLTNGSEDEYIQKLQEGDPELIDDTDALKEIYDKWHMASWNGDLLLVQLHDIFK